MVTNWREEPVDYLAAALIGAAIGAGAAFMLHEGLKERGGGVRIVRRLGRKARGGAFLAGRRSAQALAARAARGVADRVDLDAARDQIRDVVEAARDAVSDAVRHELRDARRSLRRQRKRFGI